MTDIFISISCSIKVNSHSVIYFTTNKKSPQKERIPLGLVLLLFIKPSLKCLAGLFAKNTIKLKSCVKL